MELISLLFPPIIAFGENSSKPHYTPSHVPLEEKSNLFLWILEQMLITTVVI